MPRKGEEGAQLGRGARAGAPAPGGGARKKARAPPTRGHDEAVAPRLDEPVQPGAHQVEPRGERARAAA